MLRVLSYSATIIDDPWVGGMADVTVTEAFVDCFEWCVCVKFWTTVSDGVRDKPFTKWYAFVAMCDLHVCSSRA